MGVALLCGLLIALFYDMYWLLIVRRKKALWLRALEDILFWLAAFCLVAAVWMYFTGGVMRFYIYIWLGLGVLLFRRLFSPGLRRLRLRLPRIAVPSLEIKMPADIMLRAGFGIWKTAAFVKAAPKLPKFLSNFMLKIKNKN